MCISLQSILYILTEETVKYLAMQSMWLDQSMCRKTFWKSLILPGNYGLQVTMYVICTSISNTSKSPNVSQIGLFLYIRYSWCYSPVTGWSFLNKTFAKHRVFVFKAFVNKGFRNVFIYICWWLVILFWKYLFGGFFFSLGNWTELSNFINYR